MCDYDDAQRTESMNKLSAALQSAIDLAAQVNDDLHDASSRASRLQDKSDVILDVIGDSSRLAAVLDALCTRHQRYACFLWTATRNLVRDVIGHVSWTNIQPRVKVTEDVTGLDTRQVRRAAAELDLFYGHDAHLAYADWLAEVTSCRHLSLNHDLCCRLLSHIPLLAAYTGWPTEYQLHINSQAGTQLFQTNNSNGGINATERSSSDVTAGLNGENQLLKWRPSEEDKKYIEETVRSLVDSEELCRLLMVAMAIELERLTSSEHEDLSDSMSSRHVVQSSVESAAGDHDHGDITHHVDAVHDVAGEHEQYNIVHDFCSVQTTSEALLVYFDEQRTENIGCGLESAGDGDDVRTDTIVFEHAKSDSLETASCTPSPTNTLLSLGADVLLSDAHSGKLEAENWALVSQKRYNKDFVPLPVGRSLSTLNREDVEHSRTMENTRMMKTEQATYCEVSPQILNSSVDETRTADVKNTYSGLSWSVIQNFESFSAVDHKLVNITNTSPANMHTELFVKPQPSTELHPPSVRCAVNCGMNVDEAEKNCNISVAEPCRLLGFHGEKEEKPSDRRDHYEYVSAKAEEPDISSMQEYRKSIAEVGHDERKSTKAAEPPSARRTGGLGDDCRVTFRPRRQALPVPVRQISCVNHALATETSMRQCRATSARTPDFFAQSTRPDRRPKSSQHDVKCAVRRKTVII